MGFLDAIKSLFSAGGGGQDEAGQWVYVRCRRCGEVIRTRIDLRNDLSMRDEGGYVAQKTLVGNQRCFERIEISLIFDDNRRLVGQEATRGEFVTAEAYAAGAPHG
jgi:hypothetical protein